MSSALIFMTGGIMKSYITGVFLGVVIFNTIYVNVVFGREYMNDKEKAIISGITVVITMIKLIVQHRGQVKKRNV